MILFILKLCAWVMAFAVAVGVLVRGRKKRQKKETLNIPAESAERLAARQKAALKKAEEERRKAEEEKKAALAELEQAIRRKAELEHNMAYGKVISMACTGLQQLFALREKDGFCGYVLTEGGNSSLFSLSGRLPGELQIPPMGSVGENVTAEMLRYTTGNTHREYEQLEKEPDWKAMTEELLPKLEELRQTALQGQNEAALACFGQIEQLLAKQHISPIWYEDARVQADIHLQMDFIRGETELPVLYLETSEGLRRVSKIGSTCVGAEEV